MTVIAMLGLFSSLTALTLRGIKSPKDTDGQRARVRAITSGTPDSTGGVTYLPDGQAIGPGVDPLTGAPRAR